MRDLTGQRFGRLTVTRCAGRGVKPRYKTRWTCLCDCGQVVTRDLTSLTSGDTKSCGCLKREKDQERGKRYAGNRAKFIGQKFGRWQVLALSSQGGGHYRFDCVCDCGTRKSVDWLALIRGGTLSCGCLLAERRAAAVKKRRVNITGLRFGRLFVIGNAGADRRGELLWLVRCDCGSYKTAPGYALREGHTKSCGCLKREGPHNVSRAELIKNAHLGHRKRWCPFANEDEYWELQKAKKLVKGILKNVRQQRNEHETGAP